MYQVILVIKYSFFQDKKLKKKANMAEDPELAKIRAQRMAEMQSQVTIWSDNYLYNYCISNVVKFLTV